MVKFWEDECSESALLSVPVIVNPIPEFLLSSADIVTCSLPFTQLESSGTGQHLWSPSMGLSQPNIPNPIANPSQTTTYKVELTDSFGCKATNSIQVFVINDGNLLRYKLPGAFTPNNDGLNDCFGISKWGQSIDLIVFKKYNRWGQIVFSGDFNRRCWDGKFKGLEQPSGNYVYKLKANTICGLVELKGDFMLIR